VEGQVADVVAVGGLQALLVHEAGQAEDADEEPGHGQRGQPAAQGGRRPAPRPDQRRAQGRPGVAGAAARPRQQGHHQRRHQDQEGEEEGRARTQPDRAAEEQGGQAQDHRSEAEPGGQPRQRRQREGQEKGESRPAHSGGQQEADIHGGGYYCQYG
jgi:hypothetical protein